MDIAAHRHARTPASGELDNLEVSEEVNAASIVVPVNPESEIHDPRREEWLVMFKNETHNHPTEIEPFGGAATCLGGCIRDPLSGRSYVYQAMRVTGAGDPAHPLLRNPPRQAPAEENLPGRRPRLLRPTATRSASPPARSRSLSPRLRRQTHGNRRGRRRRPALARLPRHPRPGDVILLIGGRTGRDGVGGATGSSKEHDDTALENSAEVQKGDAPTERKIQRLFRNPELTRKIKICNDFGAGGVSVAIGESPPPSHRPRRRAPKKYDGLDGTELAISESQERMAVCVDPAESPTSSPRPTRKTSNASKSPTSPTPAASS
jgi:phosphoribosylformylglycinamidine synthase